MKTDEVGSLAIVCLAGSAGLSQNDSFFHASRGRGDGQAALRRGVRPGLPQRRDPEQPQQDRGVAGGAEVAQHIREGQVRQAVGQIGAQLWRARRDAARVDLYVGRGDAVPWISPFS